MCVPIFLGRRFFVAKRVGEEVAHVFDLYPAVRFIESMLSLIFRLYFFLAWWHFETHIHFFFLI